MTPIEAPTGTVIVVGNRANGLTATKWPDGAFHYNCPPVWGKKVEYDDLHKNSETVYIPGSD